MYHNLADHMRVFLSLALLQQPQFDPVGSPPPLVLVQLEVDRRVAGIVRCFLPSTALQLVSVAVAAWVMEHVAQRAPTMVLSWRCCVVQ